MIAARVLAAFVLLAAGFYGLYELVESPRGCLGPVADDHLVEAAVL